MRLRPSIEAADLSQIPGSPAATTEDRPMQTGLLPLRLAGTAHADLRGPHHCLGPNRPRTPSLYTGGQPAKGRPDLPWLPRHAEEPSVTSSTHTTNSRWVYV